MKQGVDDGMAGVRFGRLLVFLLAYLFLSPFIPHGGESLAPSGLLVHGLLTVMLFLAASAVQHKDRGRPAALSVMGVAVVLHWLGIFDVLPFSAEAALVLFISFYSLIIYAFIKQLTVSRKINGAVIMGSLCLYLVIGLLWGSCYTLLNTLYPGAFSGTLLASESIETSPLHVFNYFSIVTLTTLGYGDITPQIPEAASLCQLEAIIGQFYTAVLVAWLVGMYGKTVGEPDDQEVG